VVSVGNIDNLQFKHIHISNIFIFLNLLATGKTWFSNFLTKNLKSAFFVNLDVINSYHVIFIETIKFFKFENLFFKKITTKQNLFLTTINYMYYMSKSIYANYLMTHVLKKQHLYLKTTLYSSRFFKNAKFLNFFISNSLENVKSNYLSKFFSKNFFSLKKNFFILLETNIAVNQVDSNWDIILPGNAITENFKVYKNFNNHFTKSLFLKHAPWFTRNFFNFFNFFIILLNFPFLWVNTIYYTYIFIISLFYDFFLESANFIDDEEKSCFFTSFNKKSLFFKENFLNFIFYPFISRNSWDSDLSFIKNSKYTNLGYAQLNVEKKTFFLN